MQPSASIPTGRSAARRLALPLVAATALAVVLASPGAAVADGSATIDFDDVTAYPEGLIGSTSTAFDDWPRYNQAGSGSSARDFAVVANADFPDSGLGTEGQSLRLSNAALTTNARSLSLPALGDGAGKTANGATVNTFEASFTIASATGGYQEGLNLDVYLDNGNNARPGGQISFLHVDGGLSVGTFVLDESVAVGAVNTTWVWDETVFAEIDDLSEPVEVRVVAVFRGEGEDTVEYFIDGESVHVGPSWEHLETVRRGTPAPLSTLTFFTGGFTASKTGNPVFGNVPAAPALREAGFLIDDISYSTYFTKLPRQAPPAANAEDLAVILADPDVPVFTQKEAVGGSGSVDPTSTVDYTVPWTAADGFVDVYAYSTPTFIGTFPVVGGSVKITLSPARLAALGAGAHTLLAIGQSSGAMVAGELSVAALLPATGSESTFAAIAGGGAVLLGLGLALAGRRRTARHRAVGRRRR